MVRQSLGQQPLKRRASVNDTSTPLLSRKRIGVRLLYTMLYVIILEILAFIIQLTALFQFIYLFITRKSSEPVRNFANAVSTYAYRVMRYITLNDNQKPFPLGEFPQEMELPEEEVSFEP
jgi:hypothetical protein